MTNFGPTDSSIHTFTTDRERWKTLKSFARENRKQPTPAEARLWQAVRGNQLGFQFRRQHAIEDYIVDFVCLRAWLVVEVDGAVHEVAEAAELSTTVVTRTPCRSAAFWFYAVPMPKY